MSNLTGSEFQQAGGCLGPGASPAASDTPGNPPTLVCSFLNEIIKDDFPNIKILAMNAYFFPMKLLYCLKEEFKD